MCVREVGRIHAGFEKDTLWDAPYVFFGIRYYYYCVYSSPVGIRSDCDSSRALMLFAGVSGESPQYRNCVWRLSTNQDQSVV